jgi:hypothetical protein
MEPRLTFNEFYQSNRFAVNAAVGLGVLTLLVVAGVAIAKALRGPANNPNDDYNTTDPNQSGTYGGATPAPETNTGQATISNTKAGSLAEKLYDAMESCGTDEDAIISVFDQLQNSADVNLVYQKFGLRNYGCVTGCCGNTYSWYGTDRDLAGWLREEAYCHDLGDTCSKMEDAGYSV